MPVVELKAARVCLVVVMASALVHWLGGATPSSKANAEAPAASTAPAVSPATPSSGPALPPHVSETRELIVAAAKSGHFEELEAVVDRGANPPEVGAPAGTQALDHLRALSADGRGLDVLGILENLLQTEPVSLPIGRDVENNAVFVWPAIAEKDLAKLSPADEVVLYRLMPAADVKTLIAGKTWTWWRLAIGADGTWLTLIKGAPPKTAQ